VPRLPDGERRTGTVWVAAADLMLQSDPALDPGQDSAIYPTNFRCRLVPTPAASKLLVPWPDGWVWRIRARFPFFSARRVSRRWSISRGQNFLQNHKTSSLQRSPGRVWVRDSCVREVTKGRSVHTRGRSRFVTYLADSANANCERSAGLISREGKKILTTKARRGTRNEVLKRCLTRMALPIGWFEFTAIVWRVNGRGLLRAAR
jgi:hypothetical protein